MLDIAEWSYHWYGVEHALLARGTMCNGMQMYVEHWIPREVRHPYPVVLIHGGYGQGSDWISTPDGRRGWATLFLEQGYKVYVLDRPGQGRNPYHPWVHGYFDKEAPTFEAVAKSAASSMQTSPQSRSSCAAMGQPMGNNPITQNVWRTRGAKLLDDIGPAILITHGDGVVFASSHRAERGRTGEGHRGGRTGRGELEQPFENPIVDSRRIAKIWRLSLRGSTRTSTHPRQPRPPAIPIPIANPRR